MTIAIDAVSGVATVTESTSFFGRAIDGLIGAVNGDHLTGNEARAALITSNVATATLSSMYTRKRVKAGQKPVMGVLF